MRKYIANIITSIRVIGSILLLFFSVCSSGFYIMYLLCGISDMIDGAIARKTGTVSEFGTKYDTVADFILFIVCVIKISPLLNISKLLWFWILVISIIKIVNVIWCYIRLKQVISLHTVLNKITGFLLFIFPLTLAFIELKYSLILICIVATVSAVQEYYYILKGEDDIK